MIKFKALSKFTIYCYCIALLVIGFVLVEQYFGWKLYSQQVRIGILVTAAIVGVLGSLVSITQQLREHLKSKG